MSTNRTIIWTPVASGVRPDGILRITLVATPQLTTTSDTTLAAYPSMASGGWCAYINGGAGIAPMEFLAVFETPGGGSASRIEAPAKRVSPDPDPKVFQTMFPDSTKVKSYVADDYSKSKIRGVDTAGLNAALNSLQEQGRPSTALAPRISPDAMHPRTYVEESVTEP